MSCRLVAPTLGFADASVCIIVCLSNTELRLLIVHPLLDHIEAPFVESSLLRNVDRDGCE